MIYKNLYLSGKFTGADPGWALMEVPKILIGYFYWMYENKIFLLLHGGEGNHVPKTLPLDPSLQKYAHGPQGSDDVPWFQPCILIGLGCAVFLATSRGRLIRLAQPHNQLKGLSSVSSVFSYF